MRAQWAPVQIQGVSVHERGPNMIIEFLIHNFDLPVSYSNATLNLY